MLANKDLEKALSYFVDNSKEMFRYNFELMRIFCHCRSRNGETVMVGVQDGVAEYEMIAVQEGMQCSFYIKFVKDEEGIWRIYFF